MLLSKTRKLERDMKTASSYQEWRLAAIDPRCGHRPGPLETHRPHPRLRLRIDSHSA